MWNCWNFAKMMDLQKVGDSKWEIRFKHCLDHVFVQETTFLTKGSDWGKNTFGHISDILKISKMFGLLRVEKMGQKWRSVKKCWLFVDQNFMPRTSTKAWLFKRGPVFVTHVPLFVISVEWGGKIIIYNYKSGGGRRRLRPSILSNIFWCAFVSTFNGKYSCRQT